MGNNRTPLGVMIAPTNEHETRNIERLLDSSVMELPDEMRLWYDEAADSDAMRDRWESRGVDLICPHLKNRV